MSFLLAKILFLLVLAALLGAWFGYWWVRRQYDDVTSEYSRLKSDWQSWRKGFEEKLAAKPDVDLKPITARIDDIPGTVRGILFPFQDRLAALEGAVGAIKIPAPPEVDLGPVNAHLEALEGAVRGIHFPAMPQMPTFDLAPLQQRLDALERAVKAIVIPPPAVIPAAQTVDLQPLLERLAAVETSIGASRVDLTPVMQKLDALAAMPAPAPAPAPAPGPAADAGPTPAMAAVVREGSRNSSPMRLTERRTISS